MNESNEVCTSALQQAFKGSSQSSVFVRHSVLVIIVTYGTFSMLWTGYDCAKTTKL